MVDFRNRQRQARIQEFFKRRTGLVDRDGNQSSSPPALRIRTLPSPEEGTPEGPGPPLEGGDEVGMRKEKKKAKIVLERWPFGRAEEGKSLNKVSPGRSKEVNKGEKRSSENEGR